MKRILVPIMIVALLATVVLAQAQALSSPGTARYLGMGNTGIAVSDDAGAVDYNPANLGTMNIKPSPLGPDYYQKPGELDNKLVFGQAQVTGSIDSSMSLVSTNLGAYIVDEVHKKHGFAVSWRGFDQSDLLSPYGSKVESFSLGYGHNYYYTNWAWGASWSHTKTAEDYSQRLVSAAFRLPLGVQTNELNLGFQFRFPQPKTTPIKVGFVVEDLLANTGNIKYNVGVSVPVIPTLTVNADYRDLGNSDDAVLNAGVEWRATDKWTLRAGDANWGRQNGLGDTFTMGVGYTQDKWRFDFATLNLPAADWRLRAQLADPVNIVDGRQYVTTASYEF
ncbi:MAG TPA: hypothetical protein VGM19_14665 [Armatimonadota bacterium]|jgi:hypothetical protein